jgi:sodium/proline symporter
LDAAESSFSMNDQLIIVLLFSVYIVGMIGIGLVGYLRTATLGDYLLGGRKMGAFVTALSAGASDMSGWLLMGLPGAIFAAGLSELWLGIGLLCGSWLCWMVVASPLRRASEELGALTISDYFEFRFNDKSRILRLLTAAFILFFFMIYTTAGLVAGGKLFNSIFSISYPVAVCIGTATIIIYTMIGGFIAVCWTDAVQGVLMVGALLAVPILVVWNGGGLESTWTDVIENSPSAFALFTNVDGGKLSTISLISSVGWGLGYFGMPHILTRFMAISSVDKVPLARRIAIGWTTLSLIGSICVGLVGIAVFGHGGLADGETVFIALIQKAFHPVFAGICLAAILAAIMSTADSQLLVCTSVITEDIYRTFFKRDASESELVMVGRASVLVISMIAAGMALSGARGVMDLVSYAWAGFGAAFGPVLILSLYWKRMSSISAISGMIAGGATVIIWKQLHGGIFELYELIPGFIIATLTALIFGYFVNNRKQCSS